MSLVATVLRIATVNALKGATLAGGEILDAPLDPAAEAERLAKPVIAVFTGSEGGGVDGQDLIGGEIELDLVVQVYIPDGIEVLVNGRPLKVDARGSGAAFALSVIERQIVATLQASPSPWAELRRRFIATTRDATSQGFLLERGTNDSRTRIPAQELVFSIAPICDPPLGGPVPALWTEALDLMRTDANLAPLVDWLEAEAAGPVGLAPWQREQASAGFPLPVAVGLGLAPVEVDAGALARLVLDDGEREIVVDLDPPEEPFVGDVP